MNNGNEAIEALLAGIQYMIDEAIKKAPYDKVKNGKVVSINGDGTYQVLLDGNEYRAFSLGDVSVDEIVRVLVPQNNYNGMLILKSIPSDTVTMTITFSDDTTATYELYGRQVS